MKIFHGWTTRGWLALTAGVALLVRIVLFCVYPPVQFTDTAAYRGIAETVFSEWPNYNFVRTPGYPVFLALLGPDRVVYLVQLILGLAATLLLFYIGWRISGKAWFGAAAGLAHTLNLGQLFFEANILSESLSTFLVILTLAGVVWLLYSPARRPLWQFLLMGLAVGVAGGVVTLTRPQYISLSFWAAFLLVIAWKQVRWPVRWATALLLGAATLALVGAWVGTIHKRFGVWGMDIMTGYHLVQHTGVFFEYVPDEYAAVRDTYIEYRQRQVVETGQPNNAIWEAIPALQDASGLTFLDLSNLMAKISVQLILKHPLLYLRSALDGWLWFWKVPFYWSPDAVKIPALLAVLKGLILAERGALFGCNLIFLAASALLFSKKFRNLLGMNTFLWYAFSVVWFTSILQTLLDHGDNPRFSVSVQSLVAVLALWVIACIFAKQRERNEITAS